MRLRRSGPSPRDVHPVSSHRPPICDSGSDFLAVRGHNQLRQAFEPARPIATCIPAMAGPFPPAVAFAGVESIAVGPG